MAEALAQIVCVREDGKDPRTVAEMDSISKQLAALKELKKWDGQAKRPRLELWDASGAKLDPKTGEVVPKPVVEKAVAEKPAPAANVEP